ncbi:cellulase family glycosylhydrolase [Flammeovirga sp. OC4]|uniref:cellulase family glycosylhydrolase n=1 Tax=Flammeovirga sp. OC4 TaxID=1382345 RepID=UPI000693DC45|nr:cellulase family glycosylhydrolase [Flammeovirga sp. OC4]
MYKYLIFLLIGITSCLPVESSDTDKGKENLAESVSRPEYNTSKGFFIKDGKLYDANGVEFIPRGVNNSHFWFDNRDRNWALNALSAIADYHSNSVRLVWQTNYDRKKWNNVVEKKQLKTMIKTCLNNGMIPMLELHDATGNEDADKLLSLAKFYVRPEIKKILMEFEETLMINIANEWSGKGEVYRDSYKKAIAIMREAGLKHTIVIDGNGWGQNIESIFEYGQEILDSDPEKNILFSVHMYEMYREKKTITERLEKASEMKLPLIVGEFGFQHGEDEEKVPYQIPFQHILSECERLGFGWYAWSWKGNSKGVEYLDLSKDWEGKELSEWGDAIVNDKNGLRNTSKKASVMH